MLAARRALDGARAQGGDCDIEEQELAGAEQQCADVSRRKAVGGTCITKTPGYLGI